MDTLCEKLYAYYMNKTRVITVVVFVVIIVFGVIGFKTYQPEPVTYTGCVVTGTANQYQNKAPTRHFIKTENCGKLLTTRKIQKDIVKGNTYDFTAEGMFSWGKKVKESTAR